MMLYLAAELRVLRRHHRTKFWNYKSCDTSVPTGARRPRWLSSDEDLLLEIC